MELCLFMQMTSCFTTQFTHLLTFMICKVMSTTFVTQLSTGSSRQFEWYWRGKIRSLYNQPDLGRVFACYQFPCTVTQKITIIYTNPNNQLDDGESLTSTGLRATFLGSTQKNTTVTAKVAQGQFDIIFCTPVQSSGGPKPLFRTLLSQKRVCLMAVDGAHLTCSWKTFRYSHHCLWPVHASIKMLFISSR